MHSRALITRDLADAAAVTVISFTPSSENLMTMEEAASTEHTFPAGSIRMLCGIL